MSTFHGIISEIPGIQVDNFVRQHNGPPPLANFLSHIHSDHTNGLAGPSYRAPFIYCTEATKSMLLRLKRRYFWYNKAKGFLEAEDVAYLADPRIRKTIMRPIPMDTPTIVELTPGFKIRVTLIDANHCPGASMFLIETDDKAILYTGDIRAEQWWIESLKRHPALIPYMHGVKTLDKIYLDTSNANPRFTNFSAKAEGIAELIKMMEKYPADTIFHINTWTFGYEDVWVAVAAHFKSQIHLNEYKFRLYQDVKQQSVYEHGPFLKGFPIGNSKQDGILTQNPMVRIHSCDLSLGCEELEMNSHKVVHISPIIRRYRDADGNLIIEKEVGEGSRKGDLDLKAAWALDMDLLVQNASPSDLDVLRMLQELGEKNEAPIPLELENPDKELSIKDLFSLLRESLARRDGNTQVEVKEDSEAELPKWFGFPYARHSSYDELQEFVRAFRPKDVYPCVANENLPQDVTSIRALFGDLCTGSVFSYDEEVKAKQALERHEDEFEVTQDDNTETQVTQASDHGEDILAEFTRKSPPPIEADAAIENQDKSVAVSVTTAISRGSVELNEVSESVRQGLNGLAQSASKRAMLTPEPTPESQPHEDIDAEMEDSQEGSQGISNPEAFVAARLAAWDDNGSAWFAKSATLTFNSTWRSRNEPEL